MSTFDKYKDLFKYCFLFESDHVKMEFDLLFGQGISEVRHVFIRSEF